MEFFYLVSNDRPPVGPVSADQLHALHTAGSITDATLVSPVGGGEWKPYLDAVGNAPPPMPFPAAAPPTVAQPPKIISARPPGPPAIVQPAAKIHKGRGVLIVLMALFAILMGLLLLRSVFVHKAPAKALVAQHLPQPHPMGDWYELGYRHGGEAKRAHEELGMTLRPERQQITHLFKDLGVDLRELPPEGVNLFYQGYVDAVEQHAAAYRSGAEASSSSLPEVLRASW